MFATYFVSEKLVPRLAKYPTAFLVVKSVYMTVVIAIVFIMLEVRSQFIYFQF